MKFSRCRFQGIAADVSGNVINDSDTKSRPKPKNLEKLSKQTSEGKTRLVKFNARSSRHGGGNLSNDGCH